MADSIWNKILIISLTVLFITLGVITGFTIGTVVTNMPEELPDVEPLSDDDQLLLLLPATYPDDPAS